ncbi:MAG: helicase-related protein, partial [Candidatus Nanoarchaeia archaeon]
MEFQKDKLNLRIYQQTILNTALNYNTLVVLPTGLGKTHIAIALSGLLCEKGKCLILAPTLPLVNQHAKNFSQYFSSENNEIVVLSGKVKASERKKLWATAKLIFATPQTIRYDLINNRISLKDVALIVFDEAHRAAGDYPYVFISKIYASENPKGRVLALTASPGDIGKVQELRQLLNVEKIEARDRDHPEIKPYIKPIVVNFTLLDLPQQIKDIKNHLEHAIETRISKLNMLAQLNLSPKKLTKKMLLSLKQELQKQFILDKKQGQALSICTSLIKLYHAYRLITTESVFATRKYFDELWNLASRRKTRSLSDIVNDFHVRAANVLISKCIENKIEHPKIAELKEIIKKEIETNPCAKILVFVEFRDNIVPILNALNLPGVCAHKFIGQASRSGQGMSQKTQAETLERFRNNEINVLVCTSVAEEGIDVPAVNLVIFYSPLPSVIRTIQRRGRTGRSEIGKVQILITKDTTDEAYYWSTKRKEEKLKWVIQNLSNTSNNYINNSKDVAQTNLNKFAPDQNITIFVDSRESKIAELLYLKGINVQLSPLKVGDFIISEEIGCERKTTDDFVNSLIDGRLFSQAKMLKENFVKPFIIIEGDYVTLFSAKNISNNALLGALTSLILDWQIPIILSKDAMQTAELLYVLAKKNNKTHKEIKLRNEPKPNSIAEVQQFFIEGLPTIGPEAAKALLK